MARASKKIYSGATDLRNRRVTVHSSPSLIVEFELDRRGISRIAVGSELGDACHSAVVNRAMPFAIRNSPRGDTLDYVSSWRASDGFAVIAGMRRVATKLINVSEHAAAVEWVSKRGRGHGHRVLGRTLAHLNATSPQGLARAARAAKWDPDLHPRGTGGRFAPKPMSKSQRRRQRRAAASMADLVAQEAKDGELAARKRRK